MARTVWGAHKRYMDTYFNVYKGYYVSIILCRFEDGYLTDISLPEMVLAATMKDIIGFVAVLMTW